MSRIPKIALLLLVLLASTALAGSSAPTFCKCTCFSNYTIIPLGPQHDADNPQQHPPSNAHTPGTAELPPSDTNTSPDFLKQTRSPFDNNDDDHDVSFAAMKRRSAAGGRVASPHSHAERKRCPTNLEEHKNRRAVESLPYEDSSSSSFSWSSILERAFVWEKRASSASCAQCNRAFCLSYNLPICKDAEEKDIQAMCFQRDSRKDQIIVWGFILGTGGLLGWAGIRRLLEMRKSRRGMERRRDDHDRGSYRPIGIDAQT